MQHDSSDPAPATPDGPYHQPTTGATMRLAPAHEALLSTGLLARLADAGIRIRPGYTDST